MDSEGNIVAEYNGFPYISSVENGYYVIIDKWGDGRIYDKNHKLVAKELTFTFAASGDRPMDNIIYPGGYMYVYFDNGYGPEAFPIKIAPELYKEKK